MASSSRGVLCRICMDDSVPACKTFHNANCSHVFCHDCLSRYISSKVADKNVAVVACPQPKCKGTLQLVSCRDFLPNKLIERWEAALCEAMVPGARKFYCPFRECSALLDDGGGMEFMRQLRECPECHRLLCGRCKVPWHSGMDCNEFQGVGEEKTILAEEDRQLLEMARKNKWKRCPRCKFLVERTLGCLHITCRCSFEFCYGCGSAWSSAHERCSTS